MSILYPGALDTSTQLPQPTAGQFVNSPSHAGAHDNLSLATIAVETKLGTGSSTPSGTNLLISTGTGSSAWSKAAPTGTIVGTSDSQTLTNKVLTSPTINAPTITNATITADAITGFSTSNTGTIYGIPITTGVINTVNTINGASLVAATVGSTALAANAVQANQIATNAVTLGYAQITTAFSTSSLTAVQVTGLTVTVTIPSGGRRVKITAFSYDMGNSTAASSTRTSLWDGTVGSGTQLQLFDTTSPASSQGFGMMCQAIVTPGAGSKTYNVGLNALVSGTASLNALTTAPAFILVEVI